MKSTLAALIAASIFSSVAAVPASKPPAKSVPKKPSPPAVSKFRQHQLEMMKISAPGDEYFGRLKMSFLGIDNTFHDDSIRAGAYTTDSHLISQVDFAEEALRNWYSRYPKDPQLPRSYFLAYAMYRKIWTQPGQDKAWQYLHIIMLRWPKSYFGKLVQRDLQGFTEHYFMVPAPCPSVAPTESPTPMTGRRRGPPPPTPTPTPTPTPAPPSPTPAPGQPAIDVLPVPCYTPVPPTPSPTPSPAPSATGSPSASPSPAASGTAPSAAPSARASTTPSPAPTRTPVSHHRRDAIRGSF